MGTYKVQDNGKAQSGLSVGDKVVTGGGTYEITGVKADGTYESKLSDKSTTTSNYKGSYSSKSSSSSSSNSNKASGKDYSILINQAINSKADVDTVRDLLYSRWDKISADPSLGKYAYDDTTKAALAYINQENINPVISNNYKNALAALQAAQKKAPTYKNSYEAQLKDIYDNIVNRDKFQYDINSDMLYQQYAKQYQNNGRLAMQDTMGQAAALTGGYGSSYGQAVGQQQYDAYLQQLNDVIPELYGMAYEQYQDEGDQLLQQYSMLGDLSDREYQLYSDAYDRWYSETQSTLSQYNNDRNFNYQKEQDALTLQYNKEQADREYQLSLDKFKYQQEQDKLARQDALNKDKDKDKPKEDKPKEDKPIVKSATYNLSELLDAAAGGMTKAQIEAVLTNRGVNVNNSAVQADIKWALSK